MISLAAMIAITAKRSRPTTMGTIITQCGMGAGTGVQPVGRGEGSVTCEGSNEELNPRTYSCIRALYSTTYFEIHPQRRLSFPCVEDSTQGRHTSDSFCSCCTSEHHCPLVVMSPGRSQLLR